MKPAFRSARPRAPLPPALKLWLYSASGALPLLAVAGLWWRQVSLSAGTAAFLVVVAVGWILLAASWSRRLFIHQLRTLNTLVEAIRREDYNLRGSNAAGQDDLSELYRQINALADQLQHSRRDERELRGLLERVITQMQVALLVCDGNQRIVLVNPRAARLMGRDPAALLGLPLSETPLAPLLPLPPSQVLEQDLAGIGGRWQITHQRLVQDGREGALIFINDLEQVLNEEESRAWQRLIRVIAHEVNNTLTPVTSLCQTLSTILQRKRDVDGGGQLQEGLSIIRERADNLRRFISDYARIARLPAANKSVFDLEALLRKVVTMYGNLDIRLHGNASSPQILGDPGQLEQVLINLIKNAAEANADASLPIDIDITTREGQCELRIRDRGPGIGNKANLFVPFYTTKDQGAGIGLALSRRILAAHGGGIALDNRAGGAGAEVLVRLPLAMAH